MLRRVPTVWRAPHAGWHCSRPSQGDPRRPLCGRPAAVSKSSSSHPGLYVPYSAAGEAAHQRLSGEAGPPLLPLDLCADKLASRPPTQPLSPCGRAAGVARAVVLTTDGSPALRQTPTQGPSHLRHPLSCDASIPGNRNSLQVTSYHAQGAPPPTLLRPVGALVTLTVLCRTTVKGLRHTPVPGDDRREALDTAEGTPPGHRPSQWTHGPAALPASGPASVWQPLATILTTQLVPGPNGGRGTVQQAKMMGACAETMLPDACSASQRSGAHLVPGTALRAGPWASPHRCPLKLGCLRTSQKAGLRRAGKSEADPSLFCMMHASEIYSP